METETDITALRVFKARTTLSGQHRGIHRPDYPVAGLLNNALALFTIQQKIFSLGIK
jgi:hypothetical protein